MLVVSCNKTPSKSTAPQATATPQGGQDVGGGDALGSTEEEVRFAVQSAIVAIQDINGDELYKVNPIRDIILSLRNSELDPVAMKIFYPKGWDHKEQKKIFPIITPEGLFKQKFKKGNIVWKSKGPCAAEGHRHSDASVSSHRIGADVCLSIENLRKIPKESLFKEMIGLLIHEIAHLEGFKETEALKLHKYINHQLTKYKTFYDKDQEILAIKNNLKSAISSVDQIILLLKKNESKEKLLPLVYQALVSLTFEMEYFRGTEFYFGAIGEDIWKLAESIAKAKEAASVLHRVFISKNNVTNDSFFKILSVPRAIGDTYANYTNIVTAQMSDHPSNENLKFPLAVVKDNLESGLISLQRNFPDINLNENISDENRSAWQAFNDAVFIFKNFKDEYDLYSPLQEMDLQLHTFGDYIFKYSIIIHNINSCPSFEQSLQKNEICIDLSKISSFPKNLQFKKALELIVEIATKLKFDNDEEQKKVISEFESQLNKYEAFLEPISTSKEVKTNIKSAIGKIDELDFILQSEHDQNKINEILGHLIMDLTYDMPDFVYPHFFKGSVGENYEKFEAALKLVKKAWMQVDNVFINESNNPIKDELESSRYSAKQFYYKFVIPIELGVDKRKALALSKQHLLDALQELNKNFPSELK